MNWRLIGGLFSLKTLLLACVLAPVPAIAIPTPALAQFQFVIPIPGVRFHSGRRYYGHGYRRPKHSGRAGRGGGSRSAEVSPSQPVAPARGSASTGGKVRGTVD